VGEVVRVDLKADWSEEKEVTSVGWKETLEVMWSVSWEEEGGSGGRSWTMERKRWWRWWW